MTMAKLAPPKKASKPTAPKKPTSRSKTGNAACSSAASNWQLALRGKAALDPETYRTLAKCRAMNRTAKMAEAQGRTGKLSAMGESAVKARLQARFDSGLITSKSRSERLDMLLKQRAERGKADTEKSKTPPALPEKPWEATRSQYNENIANYEYVPKKPDRSNRAELESELASIAEQRKSFKPYLDSVIDKKRGEYRKNVVRDLFKERDLNELNARENSIKSDLAQLKKHEDVINNHLQNGHRRWVAYAVREGKRVPANVLADYPDLKPPTPQPASEPKPAARYSLGGKLAPGRGKDAPEYRDRLERVYQKTWDRAKKYEFGYIENPKQPLAAYKERGKELRLGTVSRLKTAYDAEASKYVDSLHAAQKTPAAAPPTANKASGDRWLKRQLKGIERDAKKKRETENAALRAGAVPLSMKPATIPSGFEASVVQGDKGNTIVVTKSVKGSEYAAIQLNENPKKGKYSLMDPKSGVKIGGGYGSAKEAEAVAKKIDRLAKRASRGLSGDLTLPQIVSAPGKEGYKKLIGKTVFGRRFQYLPR